MSDKIPTINLEPIPAAKSKKDKPVKSAKKAAKAKAKPKPKAKKGKRARKPAPDLSQVPTNMVPPEIPDSRPVRVPEPEPERQPTVPTSALLADPGPDASPITVAEMETAKPAHGAGTVVETRLWQGAECTWIGPAEDAPDDPDKGHPVCPHCRGSLITCPDRATIDMGLDLYEWGTYESINPAPRPHPGYKGLLHWVMEQSHEKCWPTIELAADAYHTVTGKVVDPSR